MPNKSKSRRVIDRLKKQFRGVWSYDFDHQRWVNETHGWSVVAVGVGVGKDKKLGMQYRRTDTNAVFDLE